MKTEQMIELLDEKIQQNEHDLHYHSKDEEQYERETAQQYHAEQIATLQAIKERLSVKVTREELIAVLQLFMDGKTFNEVYDGLATVFKSKNIEVVEE